jgi:hypothetical protein
MLEKNKYFDVEGLVDEAMIAEPQFSLPGNFAELVAEKVSRKFAWEQYLKEFLIYFSVIAGTVVVWVGMSFIWFDANWKVWLDFLLSNTGLVVGINILLIFILFADRVLLRYFMFKSKLEIL